MAILPSATFVFLFFPVLVGLVKTWNEDPNYAHGYLIPFISLYIVWKKFPVLKKIPLVRGIGGVVVLIVGILIYLLAAIGHSFTLTRLTILIILPGVVMFALGWPLFQKVWFPLAYMVFMIPLPELLYNTISLPLKSLVTIVSVDTLQLLGVSVFREGNVIVLPNIVLEVADACSGIRSLISLIALSVIIAWFTQDKVSLRAIVALSAIPVSVFANSIRVILTGILVTVIGKKVAEGFFHEFAGLVIFLFSMMIVIGVANFIKRFDKSRHVETNTKIIKQTDMEGPAENQGKEVSRRIIVVSILMFLAAVPANFFWGYDAPVHHYLKPLADFDHEIAEWKMTSESQLDSETLALLKPDDYLMRNYTDGERIVTLYIGFHNSRTSSGRIHSPKHCLPSSGWKKVNEKVKSVGISGDLVYPEYVEAVYEKNLEKAVFSYWYQVGDRHIVQEYALGIAAIREILSGRSGFTAFVRISTSTKNTSTEESSLTNEKFMKTLLPRLNSFLKGV